jgi:hypothetical protein
VDIKRMLQMSSTAVILAGSVTLGLLEASPALASSCNKMTNTCEISLTCSQQQIYCLSNMPAGCTTVTSSECFAGVFCGGIGGPRGYNMICNYE